MTRFVPRGEPGIPLSRVRYSNLTQSLKDKIAEADPTEHELLYQILTQVRINNFHLMKLSGENISEEDIVWP